MRSRDMATRFRDTATRFRDTAIRFRDTAIRFRDTAIRSRDIRPKWERIDERSLVLAAERSWRLGRLSPRSGRH